MVLQVTALKGLVEQYDNKVHFEGVRFICGPHLVIIGPSEARVDLNGKIRAAK